MMLKELERNMKKSKILILLCILIAINSWILKAEEIAMVFGENKPPYSIGSHGIGLEIELARAVLNYQGHTLKTVIVPSTRVNSGIDMGNDGESAVAKKDDGKFYSNEFVSFQNFAFHKQKNDFTIDSILDMKDKSVVSFPNSYLFMGADYNTLFAPENRNDKYLEIYDQKSQNKMFWEDRSEIIVVDKFIFLWYKKQLVDETDISDDVVYSNIFPNDGITPHYCAFKDQNIRDDFNEGLEHLRSTGKYDEIIEIFIK